MTDEEIIDQAYAATIQNLYSVLFQAMLLSDSITENSDAERRFKNGVRTARHTRDTAKHLLE